MAQAVAFQAALTRIGFSQAAVTAINNNGINSTVDLIGINDKDTAQILKIIRTADPPVIVPYIAQKRLNIFCYWVNRRTRLNEPIDAGHFNQAALDTYGRLLSFETNQDDETATQVKPPAEYKTGSKWKPFKEGAIAYFSSVKGAHNIPLAYVIREQEIPDPNAVYQTEYHRLISITPLTGIEYEDDNGRVFDFLKSWTLNGPAWTWMRAFNSTRNGRASWQALVNHFEGDAQRDRVKDHAYAAIAAAKYYGDRKKFTFETYVTIHQDSYADLSQYGEIISEEKRVRDLLQGIKDNSAAANAAKGTILATPALRNSFDNAVAHLATTLQLNTSINDTRNVSSTGTYNSNNRGGHQGGRHFNRGGRGGRGRGRGRNIYLGSYSPEQWRKLSKEDKQKVYEGRNKSAEQRSQQGTQGGRTPHPGRGISAVTIQQAEPDSHSQVTGFLTDHTPTPSNISQVQVNAMDNSILQGTLTGSAAVGDKRPNTDSAGSYMSRRRINTCITTQRSKSRSVSQVKKSSYNNKKIIHGTCELDSHADTSVAGPNCIVLEYTDEVVNVSAYSEQLETMENIPIVTAATAIDDPATGETTILVIGQAIYMGDKVQNTLLCPNQMRAFGLHVDDIPMHLAPSTKPSTHSIHCPDENFNIPLHLKGIFSYFPSRTPTREEVETCKHIHLTNEHVWDPHSDTFQEQENNIADHNNDGAYYLNSQDRRIMSIFSNEMSNISTAYDDSLMLSTIASTSSSNRQYKTTAQKLATLWSIGLDTAIKTIQVTTQKGIRTTTLPIEQRFRTRQAQLRYKQLGGRHGRFYTDTFFSGVPTLNGNSMAQLFTNDLAFTRVYPMKLKSQAHESLSAFIHEVGIPSSLHSDDAKELMQGKFKDLCKEFHIPCTYTEPYSPWQNRAENAIRELKRHVRRKMLANKVPPRLWDFCVKWSSDIRNKTSSNRFVLDGRTPYEAVLGHTPDISSLVTFNFYEPVWYIDQTAEFPQPRRKLGRWLGEAYDIGQAMCYWVLPISGIPIARSTVQPIPPEYLSTDEAVQELSALDKVLTEKFGDPIQYDTSEYDVNNPDIDMDESITPLYEPLEPESAMPEADSWDAEAYDAYISAQVILPSGDSQILGTVTARKRDHHGNPVGISNKNPILDTRIYEVTFPDGHSAEYSANTIAECLYSQIDSEGQQYILLDEIVDWRQTAEALDEHNIFQVSHNGNLHPRRTTKGYQLCVKWKDGSTSWEHLKDMKEAYPIHVAEFAMAQGIQNLPGFRWWVPYTITRKNRIISNIKTRFTKKTHKYGIQVPRSIEEAYQIDRETNTDFWHQAILKEMKNNAVAFRFLEEGQQVPVGSTWIPFHMIFDVKCDLTRKARFVAGGHWTQASSQLTYSSVVTRESVRIAFLIAALNELDILAVDIGNAYLQAPAREQVHTTAGPEFGPTRIGQTVIIVRAMYGLKSSGAAWHAQLSETLYGMNFKPSLADPDVWYRPSCKENGFEYYEYILVYVDDILAISHKPDIIMKTIQKQYRLKEEPSPPKQYLGAVIKQWSIPNEVRPVWSMSATNYIKEAIRCLELELGKAGKTLKGKPSTPMQSNYRPELDVSPILDPEQANYYMSLIGILRWAVELGRVDIYIDVCLLSSHMCQPRIGHLEQVLHIFAYLKHHENSHMVFDPNYITWESEAFIQYDWTEFYKDVKEQVPPNAPPPRGHAVQINAFVDADHAGNRVTRRSHTGILIYLNCAPIIWYSKAQSTVETSTFGSEFIAMRICVEMLEAFRYKLRMFGIPIDGPANVFGDNKSVITNATVPTSTLKKKHNSIAYHRVREAVAAGVLQIAKVHTSENLADLLTKPLTGAQLKPLIQKILW